MRKFNPCKESKQQETHVNQFQPQFERTSRTNQTTKVLVISLRTRCLRNQVDTNESIYPKRIKSIQEEAIQSRQFERKSIRIQRESNHNSKLVNPNSSCKPDHKRRMRKQLPRHHVIPARRHPTRHSERKLPSRRNRKIKSRDSKCIGANQNKSTGSRSTKKMRIRRRKKR